MNPAFDGVPDADTLFFLPLGGSDEIGMNLNLYGHAGSWLMVDLGITFPEEGSLPGIEVLMPDPAFIVERKRDLLALVLTHGHEDHIGAVPYLWSRLECPIYATPFTAHLVRGKLREAGLLERAKVTEIPLTGRFTVGPFDIELITLTHSIPEPNALVLRTPLGTVLHTGDWKLDPEPLVGDDYDDEALRALSDEGVLALVGDSTNAMVEGDSGSEADVRANLIEVVGDCRGMVAIACFATNVARMESAMVAARENGRRVCLVGRSMKKIFEAATTTGYIRDLPAMIDEEDVGYLPPEEVLLLATGSQGEPRAALARLARGEHRQIALGKGDTVIFSSRVIPGNERPIERLQEGLRRLGCKVLTDHDAEIHVSGHPARDELTQMYQWVRPRVAVPVHGEAKHLRAHAALAADCQVPETIVGGNGALVRLAPGPAEIVDWIDTRRLALDGSRLVAADAESLRLRNKIGNFGMVAVTLVVDAKGELLSDPQVSLQGLPLGPEDFDALDEVERAIGGLAARQRRDDERLSEAVRLGLRRAVFSLCGKKPIVTVHLVRF